VDNVQQVKKDRSQASEQTSERIKNWERESETKMKVQFL